MQLTVTWATVRRALLGLLVAAALAGLAWASLRLFGPADPFGGAVDPERYQAVFLSTEQVYFCLMLIVRAFVVRVENLLPDSEVAQAIDRVRGGGGG